MYVNVLITVNNRAADSTNKIAGISSEEPYIKDCSIVISDLVTRYQEYIKGHDCDKVGSFEDSVFLLDKYKQIGKENGDYPYDDTRYQDSPYSKVDYFLKRLCATFKDSCWPQDTLIFTMLWNVYKRDCVEEQLKQQNKTIENAEATLISLEVHAKLLNTRNNENKELTSTNESLRNQLASAKHEEEKNKNELSRSFEAVITEFANNVFPRLEIGENAKNKIIRQFNCTDISLMKNVKSGFHDLKCYIFSLATKNQQLTNRVSELETILKNNQKNPSTSSIKTETGSPFFYKFTTFAFFCTTIYLAYIHYYKT